MDIIELENKLKLKEKIRIKGLLKKRKESLQEFMFRFFTEYNLKRPTIYASNKKIQTPVDRRRSIQDIYNICLYYYPDTSLYDVLYFLVSFFEELNESYSADGITIDNFRSSYCNMIKRRVYYVGIETQESRIYDTTRKDENNLTWNELLSLLE